MSQIQSPFKFLDPFTYEDRAYFFGRDREINALHRLVQRTPLVLLYGLSGTGKTSLVQCGLASKFDGPDWFPIWIRRRTDLHKSLHRKLNNALPQPLPQGTKATEKIQSIYNHYLRPVYLIFDQFEELFTNGTHEERRNFVIELSQLVCAELPCSIILSVREEYLGQLYSFEQFIPNLFDFRLRIEPMNTRLVKKVLSESFKSFNIRLEDPETELFDLIVSKISTSTERSEIELPYLQVYLDRLYRKDYERTYPEGNEAPGWPLLEFTREEIEEFGTINNVLDDFLRDQRENIQRELNQVFPQEKDVENAMQHFLDTLVSDEGTKRPIRISSKDEHIQIDDRQRKLFEDLSDSIVSFCARRLEQARLLRITDESMELAHDILARLIDQQRSAKQRQLRDIRRRIAIAYDEHLEKTLQFNASNQEPYFLNQGQISRIDPFLDDLKNLKREWLNFIEASRKYNEQIALEDQERLLKELKIERKHKRRFRLISIAAAILSVIALFSFADARTKAKQAKNMARTAESNAARVEKLSEKLKGKEVAEIIDRSKDLIERSDSLAIGNCCLEESIKLLEVAKQDIDDGIGIYNLPSDSLKARLDTINKKIQKLNNRQ
ncbi:AAA family ATPase [Haliscomenobacter hydrossis]|uniref:Novel STAND NTPase 1 domain-containing protein n=1 Tax=Haliscomenobacter hydrossis (strain ATCC 27775 / DSM 1100 / LMG 10767 / O) TaxID=760192 RepID=F4L1S7_HALH1|nr:AAA family ATPase [Haliscomenobacter hydrossis]AEE49586.1 hypothetical protein Halhy_1697 [Haliscomenobacter hydrossis DSM 1100]